jgi:uncharacterized protein (TIGR02391 family)
MRDTDNKEYIEVTSIPAHVGEVIKLRSDERLIYFWKCYLELDGSQSGFLVATQERIVFIKPPLAKMLGASVVIAETHLEDLVTIDKRDVKGVQKLVLNDGKKEYTITELKAPDAVASLLQHLRWSRRGFKNAFMPQLGFDPDLLDACQDAFQNEHYETAVRNAYVFLETQLRNEVSMLAEPGDTASKLIGKAFDPERGPLNLGTDKGEKSGVLNLYQGAFSAIRNPVSHKYGKVYTKEEAFEHICLADLLVKILRQALDLRRKGLLH